MRPSIPIVIALLFVAPLMLMGCAHTDPLPSGDLSVSLSLQPALDQGFVVSRVLLEIPSEGLSAELTVNASGDAASGTLTGIDPGSYVARVGVHVGLPARWAGEVEVRVRDGGVASLPEDIVNWTQLYPYLPRKVLFIGNSLTGADAGLGAGFQQMVASGLPELALAGEMVAIGGFRLEDHWDESRSPARETIATGGFDTVVLQGSPSNIVEDAFGYSLHARRFAEEIEDAGAETAHFIPQSYVGYDHHIDTLVERVEEAAEDTDAIAVPINQVWYEVRNSHGDVVTLYDDHVHPSYEGSYLYLCVLYATLMRSDPAEAGYDLNGHVAEPAKGLIEAAAWDGVRDYFNW